LGRIFAEGLVAILLSTRLKAAVDSLDELLKIYVVCHQLPPIPGIIALYLS
jgi:hypothetical protein